MTAPIRWAAAVSRWAVAVLCFYAWRYLRNVAVAVDQLGSALTFGDEDDTISSRLGKSQRGDYGRFWLWFWFLPSLIVDIVLWPFDGWQHCLRSIENDRGANAVFAVPFPKKFPSVKEVVNAEQRPE